MKKSLFFVCLFSSSILDAQTLNLGVRAGVNLINLPTYNSNTTANASFLVGVFGKVKMTNHLAIQPELFFSNVKVHAPDLGLYPSSNGQVSSNFISLPVFLRIQLLDHFHFLVGPQFSTLIKSKATQGPNTADLTSDYKTVDLSGVLGFELDISRFNAGLRYQHGISNSAAHGGTAKSSGFQLVIGYRLIGK